MDTETEVGDFVDSPETLKRTHHHLRVDKYGLDKMAEKCKERPGVPMLAGRNIPSRYSNALRTRRRDPYITKDGRVKVSIKSTGEKTDDGTDDLVDVYFVYQQFPFV